MLLNTKINNPRSGINNNKMKPKNAEELEKLLDAIATQTTHHSSKESFIHKPRELRDYLRGIIFKYASLREKETAVKFRMDTSPLTPQIVDGEKKVREQTERLYDNWKINQQQPPLSGIKKEQ